MSKILAGISIGEVSPPKGIQLAGYPHYERLNTGIHDPLYATWLYRKDERSGEQTLLMSSDLLNFTRTQVDKIKQAIIAGAILVCRNRLPLPVLIRTVPQRPSAVTVPAEMMSPMSSRLTRSMSPGC